MVFMNWSSISETNPKIPHFEDNINREIIRKVPFSTKSVFPEKHPFMIIKDMFFVDDDVRKLHEKGLMEKVLMLR